MSPNCETDVMKRMLQYLETVLEQPHPAFGGLPICPFSKKARLQNKIFYQVLVLTMDQLQPDSPLRRSIASFQESKQHDVLLFISPDEQALTVDQMQIFVEQLNQSLVPVGLTAFGGHPQDTFNVQGCILAKNRLSTSPFSHSRSYKPLHSELARTAYYQHWSDENLQQIGFHDRGTSTGLGATSDREEQGVLNFELISRPCGKQATAVSYQLLCLAPFPYSPYSPSPYFLCLFCPLPSPST